VTLIASEADELLLSGNVENCGYRNKDQFFGVFAAELGEVALEAVERPCEFVAFEKISRLDGLNVFWFEVGYTIGELCA